MELEWSSSVLCLIIGPGYDSWRVKTREDPPTDGRARPICAGYVGSDGAKPQPKTRRSKGPELGADREGNFRRGLTPRCRNHSMRDVTLGRNP